MQAQSGFASQPTSSISTIGLGSQVQASPPSFPTSLSQPYSTASFGGASSSTFGQILATPHNAETLRLLKAPPWWSNLSPKLGLYASIATSTLLLIVLVAVLVYFLVVKSCNQTTQSSTCATQQDNATCSVVDNQCVCAATCAQSTCSDVVFDPTAKPGTCQVNNGKLNITCPQVVTCDDVKFGSLQGKCQEANNKAQVTCPMATQDAFSPELSNTWTSVTSDNKCQSTLQVFGETHYCNNYKEDNNNIQGGAFTNTTFNVDDLTTAISLLDPSQVVIDDKWKYFHNVCYSNTCIGFSVANVGPGNTNMVYYPCLQSDTSTTTNKPSNFSSSNLGTIIVNNTSTNCLPNCPK